MRRLILAALLVGLAGTVPSAQRRVITYESITVAGTAIGITATITNPAGQPQQNGCTARLETAQVRYRWDGTDPTASEGMLFEVGDVLTIGNNEDARAIRFIRTGATSGVLKISCYP